MATSFQLRSSPLAKVALLVTPLLGQLLRPVWAAPATSTFLTAFTDPSISKHHHAGDGDEDPRTPAELAVDISMIAALVLLGGVFAGLTLGLMGMDSVNLKVLSTSGTDVERKHAVKVLRLLDRGRHWVLVVLLLGNVIVNESLPIFLSDFGGGTAAVLTSTFLIVIFGEIVPQSICARHGLAIGAFCAPLVHILMLLFAPVAWPTAKLLDWALGEDHGTTYRKAELKTFVSLHQQLGTENLNEDEVTIIRAVLDLNDKTVKDVMTPIEDVFTMSADHILDDEGVGKLVQSGYSRVPVHEPGKPDAILGMLLVKKLITYDPEDSMPVSWFQLTNLPEASPDLTLLDCLNFFQQGRSHMILVSTHPGEPEGALGVVTLEDVIEEMIGEEIVDETDVFVDVHNKIKVRRNRVPPREGAGGAWNGLIRGIIERRRSKYSGPTRAPLRDNFGTAKPQGALVGQHLPRAVDKVAIKRPGSPTGTNASRHTSIAGSAAGSPPVNGSSVVVLVPTEEERQIVGSPQGNYHRPQK